MRSGTIGIVGAGTMGTGIAQICASAGLDVILNRLAGFMEKSLKLRKKVKGAMIYPIAVMIVAGVILLIIMTYVVPSFETMFKDLGQQLPGPTRLLLAFSQSIIVWQP